MRPNGHALRQSPYKRLPTLQVKEGDLVKRN
jgi:hypothetical protein